MPYCTNCGAKVGKKANFCPECGFNLSKLDSQINVSESGSSCPFCGKGDKLRWSAVNKSWICDNCGKYFDVPSRRLQRNSKEEHLISAVYQSDMSKVISLVDSGANINYMKKDEQVTALTVAVLNNEVEIIAYLLEHGADVNISTNNGYTALLVASLLHSDNLDVVVDTLIKYGADVNTKSRVEQWTPLLLASAFPLPNKPIIIRLVEAGAQVNDCNIYGMTPLWYLSQFGSDDLVEYLLENGANPNLCAEDGTYIIHQAAGSSSKKFIETLKSKLTDEFKHSGLEVTWGEGLDVIADDFSYENLLIRPKVVEQLLDFGADIESKDTNGFTPLVHAITAGNTKIVETLIQRGVNIHYTYGDGETALMTAVWKGQRDIVQLLIEHGADINNKKTSGENALEWAIFKGHDDIVKLLLEAGATKEFSTQFIEYTSTSDDIIATLKRLNITL